MTQPLSSHLRDDEEDVSDMLAAITYNRVGVFYKRLRNGVRSITFRRISDNPPRFHVYWLNENGAYCNDHEADSANAYRLVKHITDSVYYAGRERGPAKKLWPGHPYHKHPSPSKGDRR